MNSPKSSQRALAYAARNAQTQRAELSALIGATIQRQPEYQHATTVLWYLHCRSEVQTQTLVQQALTTDKRVVIPYCTVDTQQQKCLGLWWLQDWTELVPGTWGILEPPRERWTEASRQIQPSELEVLIVPGVAFDQQGGRLGNGAGYYDRLLAQVTPEAALLGVCFASQLLPSIAMQAHDVHMDKVITETAVYSGQGRRRT